MAKQVAAIIGAGPAGLTAAYELARRSPVRPIVFEADAVVGGISRTVDYKGNRIDIGGHRFFSKSDRVMDWWLKVMPVQGAPAADHREIELAYQNKRRPFTLPETGPDPDTADDVMLLRPRVSRVLFGGQFYDYPLKPDLGTLRKLGILTGAHILTSYLAAQLRPVRPEASLEDFFINRFGRKLYSMFFEDYTEKVWGVPCREISAEWGAQRVKGLSISGVIRHALKSAMGKVGGIGQKETETSLIEQFLYPKYGPGHLWQKVAREVEAHGGEIRMQTRVVRIDHEGGRVRSVVVERADGGRETVAADYVFSTMPVRELIRALDPAAPDEIRTLGDGLVYRDFVTVGLLLRRLKLGGGVTGRGLYAAVPDNWIYVQEPGVKVGRIQIFNNWSPYMVVDPDTVWIGLEYFTSEGEALWEMDDEAIFRLAREETARIGVAEPDDILDHVVIRIPKTYPAYFGSYDRFDEIRAFVERFTNLYLVGRNGMHRYNNQDHSMLTAMIAVDGIIEGRDVRAELWHVNAEQDYHEEKTPAQAERAEMRGAARPAPAGGRPGAG